MKRNKWLVFLLAMVWACACEASQDTGFVLGKEHYVSIIRQFHPVVIQSGLAVRRAAAGVTRARGGFDPVLQSGLDKKTFDGKQYYSYFGTELVIPTWYGLQFKAGVEEITGERVSSESTLGQTSYAGVKLSTNELLFDSRRAALRQAQALKLLSEAERGQAVNDLFNEALAAYWDWQRQYQNYRLLSDIIRINEERLRFVRLEFQLGNRPAIDTTEVLAQLESFRQQQQASWLDFQNAGLTVSGYLWGEGMTPFHWNDRIVPDSAALNIHYETYHRDILSLADMPVDEHPKMRAYQSKITFLETDLRLKTQYLIPKLSVSANLLSKGYSAPGELGSTMLENNYKLGIDLKVPLLFREARGAYQSAKLKVQETEAEQLLVQFQLQNKIRSYYNEVINLHTQIERFEKAYAGYQRLYQGEQTRFRIGESTLFLLNSRENKVLETSQKLVELKAKWHKSYTGLLWTAGRFADLF